MRRDRSSRNDFGYGQVPDEVLSHFDDEILNQACASALNAYLMDTGPITRRPGSVRLSRIPRPERGIVVNRDDGERRVFWFYDKRVIICDRDGTVEATLNGPWSSDDIPSMSITTAHTVLLISSSSFHPQTIDRTNGNWAVEDLQFVTYPDGSLAQPYHRFEADGVTVTASAVSGDVTLQFSKAVLTEGHVGTRIQIYDQDVEILSIDGATAQGRIFGRLYTTYAVTVSSAAGYSIGEVVLGDVTQIRGEITNIVGNTLYITNTQGYDGFAGADGEIDGEAITGPRSQQTALTVSAVASPGATVRWREAMMSPARKYPSACAFYDDRIVFAGFPSARGYLAASAAGGYGDFRIVDGILDGDPFIVGIGSGKSAQIVHLVATEQLLLFSETHTWYVPTGRGLGFTPTGISFAKLRPDGSSRIQPIDTGDGVAMIDTNGRVIVYQLTGTQIKSWSQYDISVLADGCVTDPVSLTYLKGISPRKERALIVGNRDGSAAVLLRRRNEEIAGWVPWRCNAQNEWSAFAADDGDLFVSFASRSDADTASMCRVSFDAIMDDQTAYDAPALDRVGEQVYVQRGTHCIGSGVVSGDGLVGDYALQSDWFIGYDFEVDITPATPKHRYIGTSLMSYRGINVDVYKSGCFRGNGEPRTTIGDFGDFEAPPLPVTRVEYFFADEWSEFSTFKVSQPCGEGAPLTVRSITMNEATI